MQIEIRGTRLRGLINPQRLLAVVTRHIGEGVMQYYNVMYCNVIVTRHIGEGGLSRCANVKP